jgi:hypothetical protein
MPVHPLRPSRIESGSRCEGMRWPFKASGAGKLASAYAVAAYGADTRAAVDGRGQSRAAVLLSGRSLRGGDTPGLEHWLVGEGTEAEEVTVDASLAAFAAEPALGDGCEFWLQGHMTRLTR